MCLDNSQEMGAILCSLFSQLAQRYRQIKNVIFFVGEINRGESETPWEE